MARLSYIIKVIYINITVKQNAGLGNNHTLCTRFKSFADKGSLFPPQANDHADDPYMQQLRMQEMRQRLKFCHGPTTVT